MYFKWELQKKKGGYPSDTIWFHKYRLIREIGKGGSATIYLTEHIYLQSYRVMKRISKNNPFYGRLMQEAVLLKEIRHPNIPIVYDIEEDIQYGYIIEEYLQGVSLISYGVSQNRTIKMQEIISIILQISRLIQFLHAQNPPILYLDLKPENLIMKNKVVKLIDFGAAVCLKAGIDQCTCHFGTRGYAAPELYTPGAANEKSDIYGIGMIWHYLMADRSCRDRRMEKYRKLCVSELPWERPALEELISALEHFQIKNTKRQSHDCSSKSVRIIGVAGTYSGVGATYIAAMAAAVLSEHGRKKAALAECCGNSLSHLESHDTGRSAAIVKSILYFPYCTDINRVKEFSEELEYCIFDLGSGANLKTGLLSDCEGGLIVEGREEWKREERVFQDKLFQKLESGGSWLLAYNLAVSKKTEGNIKEQYMKMKSFYVGLEADLWSPSRSFSRILEQFKK